VSDTSYMDHAYQQERLLAQALAQDVERQRLRPSMLLRPTLSIDGNKWCALYGTNLMEGVAGFGDSPAEAFDDFDKNWIAKLSARSL
jgi:hypothetical protein